MNNNDCITEETRHLFLRRELSAGERETCESHLATCAGCRAALAEAFDESVLNTETFTPPPALKERVKTLARNAQFEKQPSFGLFAPGRYRQLGFAAVFVISIGLAGFYILRLTPPPAADTLRQGPLNSRAVELLSPVNAAELSNGRIEFRWNPVAKAKTYTLVILDKRGDIITQQADAQSPLLVDPATLGPAKDEFYFWFVKARLEDGATIESDTAKFRIVQ